MTVIKASVALAVLVLVLSLGIALTGMHESPIIGGIAAIILAIGINVGVVFWALKQTASENGYGKQLLVVLGVGALGGFLVLLSSLLFLNVLFPNYIDESTTAVIGLLEQSGLPENVLDQKITELEAVTPMGQSVKGMIGTFFTSLVAGAIIAIFKRRK